jgi:hypothetical protein
MHEYEVLLNKILSSFNLEKPGEIDRAYESCVDYARQNLVNDPNCNAFLHLASQRLETIPVHLDIIGLTTPLPPNAHLDLYVSDENEVVLSGDRVGLDYLADLLNKLTDADTSEHFHLDPGEAPLTRRSWPFVVYREEPGWFEEQDKLAAAAAMGPDRSTLDPTQVAVVQFMDYPPPTLKLATQKLYKVVLPTVSNPGSKHVWDKHLEGGEESRYHAFLLVNDSGVTVHVRLHLDDPAVLYFQRSDLANLL